MKRNLFLLIQIKKTSRWIRNACFIIFLSNGFFLLIHLLFALFSVYLWYLLNCLKSRVIFSEKEINKCTNVWPDKRNWAELVEIYLVQTTTLAECKLHIIYTNNLFILLFCLNIPPWCTIMAHLIHTMPVKQLIAVTLFPKVNKIFELFCKAKRKASAHLNKVVKQEQRMRFSKKKVISYWTV